MNNKKRGSQRNSRKRTLVAGLALLAVFAMVSGCATGGKSRETGFFASNYEGQKINALGVSQRLIATRSDAGGSFEVLEGVWPPQEGFAPHTHEFDEHYYVAEGAMTVKHGDKTFIATTGSFGFVPKGMVHSWKNESTTTPCKLILVFTPSFGAGYDKVMDGLDQLSPNDPDYMANVGEFMEKTGKTVFIK